MTSRRTLDWTRSEINLNRDNSRDKGMARSISERFHGQRRPGVILVVRGMMCECCVSKAKRTALSIPGVDSIDVDLENEQMIVGGAHVNVPHLLTVLEEAGFIPYII